MKNSIETLSLITVSAIVLTIIFFSGTGFAEQIDLAKSNELYKLGTKHAEDGNYVEAISAFEESIKFNGRNADAHERLGWAYFSITKHGRALVHWQQAKDIDPESSAASLGMGYLYYYNENFDSAVQTFESILSKYPESSSVHAILGRVYAQQGYVDKAILELQKSIKLNPDEKMAYWVLDEIFESQGEQNKSEEYRIKQ